jgi:hypothetical protein
MRPSDMRLAPLGLLALLAWPADDYPKYVVPDQPDLTIRLRNSYGSPDSMVETHVMLFKGARSRSEHLAESRHPTDEGWRVRITQCDAQRMLLLNPGASVYGYISIPGGTQSSGSITSRTARAVEPPSGPEIPVTVDAVDTGERRQMASLVVRHVITTTRTGPGGSYTEVETRVQDGWYADLPPLDCRDWGESNATSFALLSVVGAPTPRFHVTRLGTARRGFPLIETDRTVSRARTVTYTTELLEISDRPLDLALFDVPAGYQPALRRWSGDFDLTRPDTLVNRMLLVWESATNWIHRTWR